MPTVLHNAIVDADCHEPKHITAALTTDAGKVVTPSASVAGTSVLRFLTAAETGSLGLTGGTTTGVVNIDDAGGLQVQGTKVVGAQGAAIASLTDSTAGTPGATLTAIPDPADAPGTADLLRDDLVANALPNIRNDIASLNAKLDVVLAMLRTHGLIAP